MSQAALASMQALQAAMKAYRERMSAAAARVATDPADGVALHEAVLAGFPLLQAQARECLAELSGADELRAAVPGFESWVDAELRRWPASIELSLAMSCYRLGRTRACAQHLDRYLEHSDGQAAPERTMALLQLARLDIDAGRVDKAREHLERLDEEARHWTDAKAWIGVAAPGQEAESARQAMRQVAAAMAMRADLALAEGSRDGYLRWSAQALDLAERAGAVADMSTLWWARSSYELIWDASGERLDRAEAELRSSAPAPVRDRPDFKRRLLQMRAHVWSERGKPSRALDLLQKALQEVSADEPAAAWTLHLDIADLLSAEQRHAQALREADLALAAAKRLQSAAALRQCMERRRGLQLASGDRAAIESALAELDGSASADDSPADAVARLQSRVHLLLALRRHDDALAVLDRLGAQPAVLLEAASSASPATIAGLRAGVLRDAGRLREAAAVLEAAVEALDAAAAAPSERWRDRQRIRQTLCFGAALQHADLHDVHAALRWSERAREAIWSGLLERHAIAPGQLNLVALRQRLAARRTTVLCFVVGSQRTAALVLPADEAAAWTRTLPVGEQHWQRCFESLERGQASWNPRFAANLATFSGWLGPLLSDVLKQGVEQLAIVPDGVLALVPFAGLTLPEGCVVAEKAATVLWPTLCAGLHELPATPPRCVLSAGAGRSERHDFSAMATEVAQQIVGLGGQADVLPDAGVSAFIERLPRFDALHLSFHGSVQPGQMDPLAASTLDFHGGVRLSARGFLERRPHDLKADFAFLNACVSAGFAFDRSAGAGGFVQAMLEAGVKQVVATLAYVDPVPAQALALAFHRRLRSGATVAHALQDAQLDLRSGGALAADWASHVAVAVGL